ncbi:MAG: MarC family protein [Sneathiella sp.]
MSGTYQHLTTVFLAFFAIMNPIANTAIFVGLAGKETQSVQIKTAFKALFISFCIIVVFAISGKVIFHLFGISLPALRLTGGVLVFLIGCQMLHGESSKLHSPEDKHKADIAISPLAVPILAGPGTIATAMNYSASGNMLEISATIGAFFALCVLTFISFIFGQKILHFIGEAGIAIVTRLMGLILAVIGAQMLISGVFGAIKIYAK